MELDAKKSTTLQRKTEKENQRQGRGQVLQDNRHNTLTQRQETENKTGLPDQLKGGMENLSGKSLDHVKVHYNSDKPAAVQAHAYTQGANIHVAPGQEQHIPHELGHVIQQMEGRVQPTTEVGGLPVNDNSGLESEATQMGERALQRMPKKSVSQHVTESGSAGGLTGVIQAFGIGEYFGWGQGGNDNAPDQQDGQQEEEYPVPEHNSDVRRTWGGWYDWAAQGASKGMGMLVGNDDNSTGEKVAKSAVGGGITGGAIMGGLAAAGMLGALPLTIGLGLGGVALGALLGGGGKALGEAYGEDQNAKKKTAGQIAGGVGTVLGGLGSLVPAVLGGVGGLVLGTGGSLLHTAGKGIAGGYEHSRNVVDQSDKDVDDIGSQRTTGYGSVAWKKLKHTSVGAFGPLLRGLGSGFIGQGKDDQDHDRPSAMKDIYRQMLLGSGNSNWAKAGAGVHAVLGGLVQTGIGGVVGGIKSAKNITDMIAGKIGPGPVSSVTGSATLHQSLEQGSEAWSKNAGQVGSSGDQLGAMAQIVSGPMNMLAAPVNYFRADKTSPAKKYFAGQDAKDQALGGLSNTVRGGGFALADMAKGAEATWMSKKLGIDGAVSGSGWGLASGLIYSGYHAYKGIRAGMDWHGLSKIADQKGSDTNMLPGHENDSLDKFLVYSRDKKKSSMMRNTAAAASIGIAGLLGAPIIGAGIGFGLGGMQLWHWLSSKKSGERGEHANWLVNQLATHPLGDDLEMDVGDLQPGVLQAANVLIPSSLQTLLRSPHVTADTIKKAKEHVENRLSSW